MRKNLEKIFFFTALAFGLFAFGKNIYSFFTTPATNTLMRREYLTLMVEVPLGILLLCLPLLLRHYLKIKLPRPINLYYWFFIWLSVFLGTGLRLIIHIPFWDKILHTASPILLTAIGYSILAGLLKKVAVSDVNLWTFIIFGFAFASMCGIFWEFWEFFCDTFLKMNLQRFESFTGTPYVGQKALLDTMGDLFTNMLGALLMVVYSYFSVGKDPNYFTFFKIEKM
ncbi:hypothetical protein [Enterococcus timonensis]|uniref:hypothetical protein n=1 Tax=Enterococcus timonensis TaxID=1852364 RepID=UPI0008DAA80E|nr:hypothetical protein [Enterococcus timonensis]